MARKPRSQPFRLSWPFNADQLEKVDQMLQELYDDIRNGSINITSISGILSPANGGTGTSTIFTPGSIIFAGPGGIYTQDNANLFWDFTNIFLRTPKIIGGVDPTSSLTFQTTTGAGTTGSDFIWKNGSNGSVTPMRLFYLPTSGKSSLKINNPTYTPFSPDNLASLIIRGGDGGGVMIEDGNIVFRKSSNDYQWNISGTTNEFDITNSTFGISPITIRQTGSVFSIDYSRIGLVSLVMVGSPDFFSFPGGGTCGIVFTNGVGTGSANVPFSSMAANTAGLYSIDVAGSARMFGIDEAGVTGALAMQAASLTAGSVLFGGSTGLVTQDNANLFWDDTNNRLGILTNAPANQVDLVSTVANPLVLRIKNLSTSSGNVHASIIVENSSSYGQLFKSGINYTPYKNIAAGDLGFFNITAGNISILNDAGNINFAANGASSPQVTITNAGMLFTGLLQFGGTTSSFPALKRNSVTLEVRLADDSDYTSIHVQNVLYKAGAGVGMYSDSLGKFTFNTDGNMKSENSAGSNRAFWGNSGVLWQDADNVIVPNGSGILFFGNYAQSDFNRIQFGGTTASFPALKRNAATLEVKLADDSAYANFGLAKISTYNSISTVSGGVPAEYATIDTTGLTANIGASTLYAVPASGEGLYRVNTYVVETTAGSISSTLPNVQVIYTDKDSNTSITIDATPVLGVAGIGQTGALTANTVGTASSGVIVIYVKASTTIQYQTVNYASSLAGMTYALHIKLEAM